MPPSPEIYNDWPFSVTARIADSRVCIFHVGVSSGDSSLLTGKPYFPFNRVFSKSSPTRLSALKFGGASKFFCQEASAGQDRANRRSYKCPTASCCLLYSAFS